MTGAGGPTCRQSPSSSGLSYRCIGGIISRLIFTPFYQGFEALMAIETGDVIGGRLPPKVASLVKSWILLRRDALIDNWERGRRKLPFEKVPGADVE